MALTLPDLPYAPDALEPHIDAQTMTIHHDKHHAAYVSKANAALEGTPLAGEEDPWAVCAKLAELPEDKRTAVRNNGGGAANHALFWKAMSPSGGGAPTGDLAKAIDDAFGSFEKFKERFANAATGQFGSGWAWLCVGAGGKLAIGSTANQDNPVMGKAIAGVEGTPILGLDVWEHAYYLKYQNQRPAYVDAWWNVVNWPQVAEWYDAARK